MALTVEQVADWMKVTAPTNPSDEYDLWQRVLDSSAAYIRSRCESFVVAEVETFPEDVEQAILIQAARLIKRRYSPEGVAGFDDIGPVRISRMDADVEMLISRYLLVGFA